MAFNNKKKGIIWVNDYFPETSLVDLTMSEACATGFYNTLQGQAEFALGDQISGSPMGARDTAVQQERVSVVVAGSTVTTVVDSPGEDHLLTERADIVYFCGHGDASRIYFGRTGILPKSNYFAHYTELSLGDGALRWLILDACSTLENATSDDGSSQIFKRWTKAFAPGGGLRCIFGFHNACKNDSVRGAKFAELLNPVSGGVAGSRITAAWKSACEITDQYAEWAYLMVGDSNSIVKTDRWTNELYAALPAPSNGTQTFSYVRKTVSAVTNIQIIS